MQYDAIYTTQFVCNIHNKYALCNTNLVSFKIRCAKCMQYAICNNI